MKTSAVRAALATASAVIFTTSASVAAVDDMTSLRMEIDKNGKGEEFAMIRCAGFYLSVLNYTGAENLEAETAAQSKSMIEQMVYKASDLREQSSGDDTKEIIQEVLAVSNKYLMRYRMNFEAKGDAFSTDPVWQSDSDTCAIVRASLMQ